MRFFRKKSKIVVLGIILILGTLAIYKLLKPAPKVSLAPLVVHTASTSKQYKIPTLPKSKRYDIYLIGDSMTRALGPRGGIFTELISKAYPGTFFEVSNYAKSENIMEFLGLIDQPYDAAPDVHLKPLLQGKPDPSIIIIESFGYNPLSKLGLKEGLKKQNEVLGQFMSKLEERYPDTVIMFMATIAPDKKTYGKSINKNTADERWVQAEERIEYLTNHIKYAEGYKIPLINVYATSIDTDGDGDVKYINPDDNIHPSAEGQAQIARVMVKTIQDEKIIPQ